MHLYIFNVNIELYFSLMLLSFQAESVPFFCDVLFYIVTLDILEAGSQLRDIYFEKLNKCNCNYSLVCFFFILKFMILSWHGVFPSYNLIGYDN